MRQALGATRLVIVRRVARRELHAGAARGNRRRHPRGAGARADSGDAGGRAAAGDCAARRRPRPDRRGGRGRRCRGADRRATGHPGDRPSSGRRDLFRARHVGQRGDAAIPPRPGHRRSGAVGVPAGRRRALHRVAAAPAAGARSVSMPAGLATASDHAAVRDLSRLPNGSVPSRSRCSNGCSAAPGEGRCDRFGLPFAPATGCRPT